MLKGVNCWADSAAGSARRLTVKMKTARNNLMRRAELSRSSPECQAQQWIFRKSAMACDLQHQRLSDMAGRMNMLKLLQEVRGFAQFPAKPSQPRQPSLLSLQYRGRIARIAASRHKFALRVDMQEPVDIPQPIPIRFLVDRQNTASDVS